MGKYWTIIGEVTDEPIEEYGDAVLAMSDLLWIVPKPTTLYYHPVYFYRHIYPRLKFRNTIKRMKR